MKRFNWLVPCSFTAVWLLVLPAACSVDLTSLSAGCKAPLVNCKGKCESSCGAGVAGGGSSGSDVGTSGADSTDLAGAAGQTSGGGSGETGDTGGTGGMAGTVESGGSGGNPLVCTTVSYPFHYTPQPPTWPIPTMGAVVTGDWLNWLSTGVTLTVGEDGTYRGVADVPIGRRLYKFVVDGKTWVNDPDNVESESDNNNGKNSILVLKCGVDYSSAGGTGGG